ncbi:hypothetical protein M9H77_34501 [Catharanthus roseus]|uniref:Uncharacterized protein n=2 Tax=Catharanthus roseus TaxID=4058 RepID=A0ACB9ZNI0_CATRO|nr:hypothetical protein M9H77_34497 [Catharanthus roseus]KAI5648496.1 hypothetical protein M9H77_34501 [Catharanthus roseus]
MDCTKLSNHSHGFSIVLHDLRLLLRESFKFIRNHHHSRRKCATKKQQNLPTTETDPHPSSGSSFTSSNKNCSYQRTSVGLKKWMTNVAEKGRELGKKPSPPSQDPARVSSQFNPANCHPSLPP